MTVYFCDSSTLVKRYITEKGTGWVRTYQYPLRAYDAVQLASVHILNQPTVQSGRSPLVFLSADVRLLNIANSIGLLTDNPENYP